MEKFQFAQAQAIINMGGYHVQEMYLKHGSLRGEATFDVLNGEVSIFFEYDMPEPPSQKVHVLELMQHLKENLNKCVLEHFYRLVFIDHEHECPTPLAAEYPDLAAPFLAKQVWPPTPKAPT